MSVNYIQILFALITFFMVFFGILINTLESYLPVVISKSFRYGKFANTQESSLAKKLEVPKSCFKHFYFTALIINSYIFYLFVSSYIFDVNIPKFFINIVDFSCGCNRKVSISATHAFVAISLIYLQVLRRFYDTHFVSVFSKNGAINISHYFIGMIHYPALLLTIISEAPKFDHKTITNNTHLKLLELSIFDVFAIILFLWAWYHQHITTKILANLRKNKKGDVVTQSHKIPHGDWFKYLSSPHSTAEILMYTALTIILINDKSWWFVYIWVVSNQAETILLSHWWYQSSFPKFPKERKALIPFVY